MVQLKVKLGKAVQSRRLQNKTLIGKAKGKEAAVLNHKPTKVPRLSTSNPV